MLLLSASSEVKYTLPYFFSEQESDHTPLVEDPPFSEQEGDHTPSVEDHPPSEQKSDHTPSVEHPPPSEQKSDHTPSVEHPPPSEQKSVHTPSVEDHPPSELKSDHTPSVEDLPPSEQESDHTPSVEDLPPSEQKSDHTPSIEVLSLQSLLDKLYKWTLFRIDHSSFLLASLTMCMDTYKQPLQSILSKVSLTSVGKCICLYYEDDQNSCDDVNLKKTTLRLLKALSMCTLSDSVLIKGSNCLQTVDEVSPGPFTLFHLCSC